MLQIVKLFSLLIHRYRGAPTAAVLLQNAELTFQFLRRPQIIGILKRKPTALRRFNAVIPRRAGTGILLRDHPDATAKTLGHCDRVIRRAIIHDHDFKVREGLRQHALQSGRQTIGPVEHRDNDADGGSGGHVQPRFRRTRRRIFLASSLPFKAVTLVTTLNVLRLQHCAANWRVSCKMLRSTSISRWSN